ncbi:response regulator [Geminicoccus flavidas]|uniref:response regulator n=1 Tax=Geminicoccus flavidas TaxID=2506407 RepID=UPI00135A35C4|nr:response regulator [Geminicoccus flavidas]
MAEAMLAGRRVLVAEDEYMLADDLRQALEDEGAVVLGPVPHLGDVLALIGQHPQIDAAVLDVNLGGEMVWPAADLLSERGVPFLLTTGYERSSVPSRHAHVTRCEKPITPAEIARALAREVQGCAAA